MYRIQSATGWKISSKKGWLYLSIGAEIYVFHIALGRFAVSLESGVERRANLKAELAARRREAGQ